MHQIDRKQMGLGQTGLGKTGLGQTGLGAPASGTPCLADAEKPPIPWPTAPPRGLAQGDTHTPDDPASGAPSGPPVLGVERRLVRRAEALWDQLRGTAALPTAAARALFALPPFADFSFELAFPPHAEGDRAPALSIGRVGKALGGLGAIRPGPVRADIRRNAPLANRLAALGERALLLKAPVLIEIDGPRAGEQAEPVPVSFSGILLRAVALPFHPPRGPGGAGPTVVLVVTWRQLLSEVETRALHGELAAAIDWLKTHG